MKNFEKDALFFFPRESKGGKFSDVISYDELQHINAKAMELFITSLLDEYPEYFEQADGLVIGRDNKISVQNMAALTTWFLGPNTLFHQFLTFLQNDKCASATTILFTKFIKTVHKTEYQDFKLDGLSRLLSAATKTAITLLYPIKDAFYKRYVKKTKTAAPEKQATSKKRESASDEENSSKHPDDAQTSGRDQTVLQHASAKKPKNERVTPSASTTDVPAIDQEPVERPMKKRFSDEDLAQWERQAQVATVVAAHSQHALPAMAVAPHAEADLANAHPLERHNQELLREIDRLQWELKTAYRRKTGAETRAIKAETRANRLTDDNTILRRERDEAEDNRHQLDGIVAELAQEAEDLQASLRQAQTHALNLQASLTRTQAINAQLLISAIKSHVAPPPAPSPALPPLFPNQGAAVTPTGTRNNVQPPVQINWATFHQPADAQDSPPPSPFLRAGEKNARQSQFGPSRGK